MNLEKEPSGRPPEDNERQARVRYVELNGVRYRSRETSRVGARGNLLERVNELRAVDGSNKVFLQREVFDPELGLLTEVTRADSTDGEAAEDKEEYRYRKQPLGLAFFRYVRRLSGVKTAEQTEKYGSAGQRPEELERVEYDQAGQPTLRRLEELDPADGRLLKATTEFYENGLKVLEVVEIFNSADGGLVKRLSTRYDAGREIAQEVENLAAEETADPASAPRPVEPVFTQIAAMSIPKAEAADETPSPAEPAVSPAALLAGFIYAKSIEDNRKTPQPPAYLRETKPSGSDRPEAKNISTPAAETAVGRAERLPENPREAVIDRAQAGGPEADVAGGDPEKRDVTDRDLRDMPELDAARPLAEKSSPVPAGLRRDKLPPDRAATQEAPPAKTRSDRRQTVKIVLIVAAVMSALAAIYYIFGSI